MSNTIEKRQSPDSKDTMQSTNLVLGIDGGGTKTLAWLASKETGAAPVGIGLGGPGNFQAVGIEAALANLDASVEAAFADATIERGPVAAAVLGLAGSDREENRRILDDWAATRQLARKFRVVNDALPIIAAGSPESWGVGLISGTGSFCFGQAPDGRSARSGGWGYLFGDEGSGYSLTVAGLRAAAQAADGRGPQTQILDRFLPALEIETPAEMVKAVYAFADDRGRVASLSNVVTEAADAGDEVANQIVDHAAEQLALMVQAVARSLDLSAATFPLALTGGVLCATSALRSGLEMHLRQLGLAADPIAVVEQPVAGTVKLAQIESAIQ